MTAHKISLRLLLRKGYNLAITLSNRHFRVRVKPCRNLVRLSLIGYWLAREIRLAVVNLYFHQGESLSAHDGRRRSPSQRATAGSQRGLISVSYFQQCRSESRVGQSVGLEKFMIAKHLSKGSKSLRELSRNESNAENRVGVRLRTLKRRFREIAKACGGKNHWPMTTFCDAFQRNRQQTIRCAHFLPYLSPHFPESLATSQFPVFTLYASKTCVRGAGDLCGGRQWSFDRVAGNRAVAPGYARAREKAESRERCLERCLFGGRKKKKFICRWE